MDSFEDRYYLHEPTPARSLRRDLRLLFDSAVFLYRWCTMGRRVRAAYRAARRRDSACYLEDILGDGLD